jgi:hypothetical protein
MFKIESKRSGELAEPGFPSSSHSYCGAASGTGSDFMLIDVQRNRVCFANIEKKYQTALRS